MSVLGRAWIRAGLWSPIPSGSRLHPVLRGRAFPPLRMPNFPRPGEKSTTQIDAGDAGLGVDRARCNTDLLWQNNSGEAAHPLAPGS